VIVWKFPIVEIFGGLIMRSELKRVVSRSEEVLLLLFTMVTLSQLTLPIQQLDYRLLFPKMDSS